MAPFFIPFLAFCFLVPFQIDATAAKSEMELANSDLELACKNNTHRIGSGEQNGEVHQFVHELVDQYSKIAAVLYTGDQAKAIDYSMIEAALYGDSQSSAEAIKWQNSNSIVDGISKINLSKNDKDGKNENETLSDEFDILKRIDQLDRPMANLLQKLHNSISDLMDSINGGKNDGQNAKLQNLKTIIIEAVKKLAELWDIPLIEINQLKNEQNIDQKSILKELAKFWHKFKRQKGQNEKKKSDEKRKDDQKRILKLIMDLSIDGIDGLANLKGGEKKSTNRRRRRRKRDSSKTIAFLVLFTVLFVFFAAILWRNRKRITNRGQPQGLRAANIENPTSPEDSQSQMAPEGREDPNAYYRSFSTQSQEGLLQGQSDYDADQSFREGSRTRRKKDRRPARPAPDVGSQMHYAQEYYQRPAHRSEAPTRSDYDADAEPRPRSRSGRAHSKERRRRSSTPRRETQQQSAYVPHVAVDVNSGGIQHDDNWQNYNPREWDQANGGGPSYAARPNSQSFIVPPADLHWIRTHPGGNVPFSRAGSFRKFRHFSLVFRT